MSNVISTKNLTKSYGAFDANDNISLDVKEGCIYGLIGRNGAGKTTFMKMLLGLTQPTSGEMSLFGKTGAELKEVRKNIGFIIETPAFYTNLSAYENLQIMATLYGIENTDQKIMAALKKVGLEKKAKLKVKSYSLGMKQSLGIAAAIMNEPKLLILDEPVNGLDPIAIVNIREILQDLNKKGTTIIISSHILGELQKLATCYGFILNGKLIKEVSEEEVETQGIDLEELFVELAKEN